MERIVAIINTQGVLNDVVDSNIEILTEEGFVILDKKKVQLTQDQVAKLNIPEADAALYYNGSVVLLLLAHTTAYASMNEIFPMLDDVYYAHTSYLSLRDESFLFPGTPLFERTVCILKPGYTQEDLSLIIDAFTEQGFIILGKIARVLPIDAAQTVNASLEGANIMASEVSVLFALEKSNAIKDLKLLLGPEDPEEARLHAPYTIRARIGKDIIRNGAYCSYDVVNVNRDFGMFFSNPFVLERTILIVKNHALSQLEYIRSQLQFYNFTVIAQDTVTLSPIKVELLFSHINTDSMANFIAEMTAGACHIFLLTRPSAVMALKMLIGPNDLIIANRLVPYSMNNILGQLNIFNSLEYAQDNSDALRLTKAIFPYVANDHLLNVQDVDILLNHSNNIAQESLQTTLTKGLIELCRVKPQGNDAIKFLADWLLRHNPKKPSADIPSVVEEPEQDIGLSLHNTDNSILVTKTNAHHPVIITQHHNNINSNLSGYTINTPLVPKIIMSFAGPGTVSHDVYRFICNYTNLYYIHVPTLIQAALSQNTDISRILSKNQRLGRAPPSHIIVKLIKDAMKLAGNKNVLLAQCPLSLDDALELEAQDIKPHCFLMFTCSQDAAVTRLIQSQTTPMLREQYEDVITTFIDEVQPVVEYYDSFKKMLIVDTDDTSATCEEIAHAASVQLLTSLKTVDVQDKKPMKQKMPPRKKVVVSDEDENTR